MSTPKSKGNYLPPLQKRIVLYLAKHEPQTINEIDKGTHKKQTYTYKGSYTALKSLQKKGLINKINVKTHHNIEYPRFWLSNAGVFTALVEGADAQDLLKRIIEVYPNDRTLHLLLKMAPFSEVESYRVAFSALLSKGRLEQSDMIMIMITQMQRDLSIEQFNHLLKVLREFPEEYEKITKQMKQLAELLEKKGEVTNFTA